MANFIELASDPIFIRSLINTIYYAAVQVPLSLGFALLLAVMLNNKLKGIYTFRAIYYLPALTSGVAIALLWRWIFNPETGFNIFFDFVRYNPHLFGFFLCEIGIILRLCRVALTLCFLRFRILNRSIFFSLKELKLNIKVCSLSNNDVNYWY